MTGASATRSAGDGGHAARELPLRPDPPHQIRWLDLTTAAGEPATRIDLDPQTSRCRMSP